MLWRHPKNIDEDEGRAGDEAEDAAIAEGLREHEADIAAVAKQHRISAQHGDRAMAGAVGEWMALRQADRGASNGNHAIEGDRPEDRLPAEALLQITAHD